MDKKIDKKEEKLVRETLEELLKLLGIEGDFEMVKSEEGIDIALNTPDTGIVIGYHGEVLESLQLISSLAVSKKIGRFLRISIEVGDYKKNRTEYLKSLAAQTKERAISEKAQFSLPNLKSWERRIIHILLKDDKDVTSESAGEGKDRVLIIKPR